MTQGRGFCTLRQRNFQQPAGVITEVASKKSSAPVRRRQVAYLRERLNANMFTSLADARQKIEPWRSIIDRT
jgi:hypothetical protein